MSDNPRPYEPPTHWQLHDDGVRVYRGSELVATITRDMAARMLVDLATLLRG